MKTIHQVTLSDVGLFGLKIKVEKLNKRAKRLGLPLIELDVQTTVVLDKQGLEVDQHAVTVRGVEPRADGWRLVCRIELGTAIGAVVRLAPGIEDDGSYTAYNEHDGYCDHCKTRRFRKDVYILEKDGVRKAVGRNCLADFCRDGDAESIAMYGEMCDWPSEDELSEEGREGGYGRDLGPAPRLESYLSLVHAITRTCGWVSRTEAKENDYQSTADNAAFYYFGHGRIWEKFVETIEVNDRDREIAVAAIEWAASADRKSSYIDTISRLAELGRLDWKLDGYAASIIRAHQKAQEWEAERIEKESTQKEKAYVGCKGERLRDLKVTVKRVRYFEGAYGVTTIVAMEHDMGEKVAPITWFASGEKEYDEGAEYLLTGTVKKQETDDKWGCQTMMNRCKLQEVA